MKQVFLSVLDTNGDRISPLFENLLTGDAEMMQYEMELPASASAVDLFPAPLSSVTSLFLSSDEVIELRLNGAVSGYDCTVAYLGGATLTGVSVVAPLGATLKIVLLGVLE
ncbi:MAG: hypothetical protein XU15_C0011G0123 [candidate division NC10 bacterium CSP1-5]|nr:MAG: hypothetical protein XU15_C0011G0123 [candidate division NC10 bacterium CSP1-5]